MLEVTQDTFQDEVIQAEGPVVVDFGAVWCGPCKMLDPIVDDLAANEWADNVKVVKVDVDHNPDIAMQYGVMGVPTLMVFNAGEMKERMTGYQPKDKIIQKFEAHLA
ncbi:MAG: thioredoxin [Chloroflexi bacterium]|nr:MAG: thioredoxin [Chloroflexota bacterium]MBL1196888.1 thioredoxin [Chloroflexota bacterium]NOH14184.1 thioredoxin [Chloroflexota bacterium]